MIARMAGGLRQVKALLKSVGDRVTNVIATVIYSAIYIIFLPWFSWIAKKYKGPKRSNWHPWPFHADSIEDMRKQY